METARRTIWTYYAYRATTSFGFWVPVGTLFLVHRGYGLDAVGMANAGFVLALVAAEIPAGYAADRIGRRASLAVSNGLTAVVMAAYAFVGSAWGFVALYALWGVGYAFRSAIGRAWLYDLLAAGSDESAFARTSGRGETAELLASAATAIPASLLYALDPALPFLANAGLAAAGLPLLVALPATRGERDGGISIREVVAVLGAQVHRPEVRWLVAYAALFNALFSMTRWLEQPALEAVGVPVAAFGTLYAGFRIATAGATAASGWIQERLGPYWFFGLLVPVCALAYAAVAIVPVFVVPVVLLRRVVDRVSGPVRDQYVNDRLSGFGRATVLSGVSMVLHLASGVSNAAMGAVAETVGPVAFLPWAGVGVAAVAGLLWLGTSPVRPLGDGTATTREAGIGSD